jgi:hypothetical protein
MVNDLALAEVVADGRQENGTAAVASARFDDQIGFGFEENLLINHMSSGHFKIRQPNQRVSIQLPPFSPMRNRVDETAPPHWPGGRERGFRPKSLSNKFIAGANNLIRSCSKVNQKLPSSSFVDIASCHQLKFSVREAGAANT